jgi:hypothetical protein
MVIDGDMEIEIDGIPGSPVHSAAIVDGAGIESKEPRGDPNPIERNIVVAKLLGLGRNGY